ncbi:MAG: hypothetical protein K2L11_00735 [Muribaculaceae bacterium]|nr:hypothetical protein [Muribaculaceae bacterium]
MLYFRLLLLTFVNLYAVRVTLEALGDIDFGLYNVIASVVTALTVLTGAMTSATQRFLSFHLGRKDYDKYSHIFTIMLLGFIGLAIILLLLGEILGYFFIYKWLTIPPDRLTVSYWVYQASLISFAIGFITIPYSSSIVANEKMNAFALFSIVEGVMKLAIAFTLIKYAGDRLILYGVLTALITVVIFFMTMHYCHSRFKFCRYIWKWDGNIFREVSKYTGWNLFGSISGLLTSQGQNILLNIFFGPILNAAKAIADRIHHVINGFSINLYMAVSPQIIKAYSVNDLTRAMNLVMKTSKISFLLIFILSFPLICNIEGILQLWLGAESQTPDMATFSQLLLIYCMVLSLEPPISRIIQATGDIRNYQLSTGIITLSYLPITALILIKERNAILVLVTLICIMTFAQVIRVIIAHRQVNLIYSRYIKEVVFPIAKVTLVGIAVYWAIKEHISTGSVIHILSFTVTSAIFGIFIAGVLGLDRNDRNTMMGLIKTKFSRVKNA